MNAFDARRTHLDVLNLVEEKVQDELLGELGVRSVSDRFCPADLPAGSKKAQNPIKTLRLVDEKKARTHPLRHHNQV